MSSSPPPIHPELRIGQASRTKPGDGRNQDFHGTAEEGGARRSWGTLVCVADGVGDCGDGRLAAEVTVSTLLNDYFATPLGWRGIRALYVVGSSINNWLFHQGRGITGGLGTTLVAALFRDRMLSVMSAGDSRLYRWREGRLLLLTRDHAYGPADFSRLTKAVGLDDRFTPDLLEEALLENDRYLLTSDGAWRELKEKGIRRWATAEGDPQTLAEGMVDEVARAGADDATVVVVDVARLPAASLAGLLLEWRDLPVIPPPAGGGEVDGFRIDRILHKGGQGVVALAWDRENRLPVVLKFPDLLSASDPAWMERFVREEWIGLQVRHPNVVKALPPAIGRRRAAYHVLEALEGYSLEAIRQERGRRGLPVMEVADWLRQAAKGLLALHRQGIGHGDVKPDNLFLTNDQRVVVLDFGAARIEGFDAVPDAPHRAVGGTPGFMAPELHGSGSGGASSDLFALGVTAYLLLSGRFPYGQPEPYVVPGFEPFVPLTILRPDLPPPLASVVERCLALEPEERPGDLGEFISWLDQPEWWTAPPAKLPLLQRHPLRFYQVGFWVFLVTTILLMLLRLRG